MYQSAMGIDKEESVCGFAQEAEILGQTYVLFCCGTRGISINFNWKRGSYSYERRLPFLKCQVPAAIPGTWAGISRDTLYAICRSWGAMFRGFVVSLLLLLQSRWDS